eukprot:3600592-Rhodomonas_salina.3
MQPGWSLRIHVAQKVACLHNLRSEHPHSDTPNTSSSVRTWPKTGCPQIDIARLLPGIGSERNARRLPPLKDNPRIAC